MTETLFPIPEEWWVRKRCPVCGGARSLIFSHMYVVQRQWWIKIGATNRPHLRHKELSREDWKKYILYPEGMDWTEPLTVHAMVEPNLEHETHQRFHEQHVIGEWFLPDDEIRAWLEELAQR